MKLEVMLWLVVFASVAIGILLPKYRSYSFVAVGVLIITIVAIVVLARRNEPAKSLQPHVSTQATRPEPRPVDFEQLHIANLDKTDPEAKNRIAISETRFDQIRPELGSDPGTIRLIRARLYNDSKRYTLTDYAYYLKVQDCVESICTTVYDQRGQAAASVPPNQARDVVISIRDGELRGVPTFKLLGTPKIELSPTDTRSFASTL